jgi:hypothetical protein
MFPQKAGPLHLRFDMQEGGRLRWGKIPEVYDQRPPGFWRTRRERIAYFFWLSGVSS